MKKKCFTLLETLLAFSLFAVILGSLIYWYTSLNYAKNTEAALQKKVNFEKNLHRQLQKILPKADGKVFYTTFQENDGAVGKSLVFTFDHGPQLEPLLSDAVLGRLYLDNSMRVCLGIWPWDSQEEIYKPCRKITLLENVTKLDFSFFFPPDPFPKPVDPEKIGEATPEKGWQEQWNLDYKVLPALVKIKIGQLEKRKNKEIMIEFGYCMDPKLYPVIFLKPQEE